MPNIQAVSKERHADKFWKPVENYTFTAEDVLCPLVAHEIPEACLSLPIAFSKSNDKFIPVAILGLKQSQNLILGPMGEWRGPYVPRVYRCFPFSLALTDEESVLCIDEEIALTDESLGANPFFQDNGEATETVLQILKFLSTNVENATQTELISDSLSDLNLIEPWPLQVNVDQKALSINGLYRINETALNDLSLKDLATIRDNRALIIVYSQLLSMAHIKNLAKLAQNSEAPASKELDFDALDDGGTISFNNL